MRRLVPLAPVALLAALDALLASAAADCTCRAQGRAFELGQTACLITPKGARLATCGMDLNVSSWQFSEVACTVSDAAPHASRPGEPQREPALAGTADQRATLVRH